MRSVRTIRWIGSGKMRRRARRPGARPARRRSDLRGSRNPGRSGADRVDRLAVREDQKSRCAIGVASAAKDATVVEMMSRVAGAAAEPPFRASDGSARSEKDRIAFRLAPGSKRQTDRRKRLKGYHDGQETSDDDAKPVRGQTAHGLPPCRPRWHHALVNLQDNQFGLLDHGGGRRTIRHERLAKMTRRE